MGKCAIDRNQIRDGFGREFECTHMFHCPRAAGDHMDSLEGVDVVLDPFQVLCDSVLFIDDVGSELGFDVS